MSKVMWRIIVVSLLLVSLLGVWVPVAWADPPYDDLTPNELTFDGRRGTVYTATWDPDTYEVTVSTPDGTFPWDWISFVGPQGAVALNGYPDVGQTFDRSDPQALAGAQPGDLIRIKGRGVLGQAHLTKIGLVIGTGASAQRAWFSEGNITEYVVAPHYVGYEVQVLGRTAQVRVTAVNPQDYYSVGIIEVSLDDTSDAQVLLVSDLEPTMDYRFAVEFHSRNDTVLTFLSSDEALRGTQGSSAYPVYVYSDQALHSWSGNNLTFDQYLAADTLDGQLYSPGSDGRVALKVIAQPTQYFYIGSRLLDSATRADPTGVWNALRDQRAAQLDALPVVDSLEMPQFKFINLLSSIFLTYLVNPDGGLFYTDKAFLYLPDSVMPAVAMPHLLPPEMVAALRDGVDLFARYQWDSPVSGHYSQRLETGSWPALPSWYAGNFPDIMNFRPGGSLHYVENYCDVYPTAMFINALYRIYLNDGDQSYAQSHQSTVEDAVSALQVFDSQYDGEYGEDGNLFPNVNVPMGDLGLVAGEYPAESAQTIYAYEDAAELFRLYGEDTQADQLIADYVTPMRSAFDGTFWSAGESFFLPVADERSQTRAAGTVYQDRWAHTMLVPLRGDVGQNRLAQMLDDVFTGPDFYEPEGDVHWLAVGDENFATPGRWGLSTHYTNGWGMEGGFFVLPNVFPPLGYYQLGRADDAEVYANIYFDKWAQYGPYEAMMEYDGQMPGRFGESSIYMEAVGSTLWLLQEALGVEVDGTQVTIVPRLSGQFVVRNLHVTARGLTAVLNYARDSSGVEYVEVVSNQGLTIDAPQANPTAVTLSSLGATGGDDAVLVEWETADELGTVGFNPGAAMPATASTAGSTRR